jgi:hypothetical protein
MKITGNLGLYRRERDWLIRYCVYQDGAPDNYEIEKKVWSEREVRSLLMKSLADGSDETKVEAVIVSARETGGAGITDLALTLEEVEKWAGVLPENVQKEIE